MPGLRRLGAEEIREVEPYAVGLAALHSPATAITDYVAVARAMAAEVEAAGGEVRLRRPRRRHPASGRRCRRDGRGDGAPVRLDHVVVAAGLQADRVATLAGRPRADDRAVPR